jgi:hypothetical protein
METKKKIVSNPAQIGIGMWISIHLMAKNATNIYTKNSFIDYMYMLSQEFPCGKCRTHIQEYLKTHSFDPFMDMQNENGDIGMFKWSWIFHNAVNTRLGKPYLDWNTALEMYYPEPTSQICTNCDEHTESPLNKIDKKSIIQGYFMKRN